eukprot:CAMPEP_0113298290 /NCGR_PEP_ID=MMETSP0010_2-20120614/797_1 /TAXON_ID=216773 ORGANISM="Corethron hystrix, Strain 308" /NCGR_SAMPLE_ID=MMETSP0010_2 /ASSEMBLY_ACC=CAM_ASM_000155 /LENGTH=197 /DNA_ID=CAMNT_0000151321 /DNA_START=53 /DNA_END=646 /DNA_ORIENTATION=- /assembly_acc=CAM_ASM_000155
MYSTMRAAQQLVILTTTWAVAFAFEVPTFLPSPPPAVCSRRKLFEQFRAVGAAACTLVTVVPPRPTVAAPPRSSSRSAARFAAEYDDMLHPGCDRRIEVDPTPIRGDFGESRFLVRFSGTDVGPDGLGPIIRLGCTEETVQKYKLRSWSFEGRVNAAGTDIDAGDNVHVGRWHVPTEDQAWAGIRWADGNRWIVKKQ